jgi:hypothetical protein
MSELGGVPQATLRCRVAADRSIYAAVKRLGRPRETDLRAIVDVILCRIIPHSPDEAGIFGALGTIMG